MKKDRVVSEMLGEDKALTPSDLYSKEFKTNLMGGYDKDEVEHYLERVADVLESLIKQNRELKERNTELRQEAETFHEMESSLRNALITSQKFHENVLDNARREADAMLEEAKLAKALAITKASKLPELLQSEINTLRAMRDQLRAELRVVLKTHVELLGQLALAEDLEIELARQRAAHGADIDDGDEDIEDEDDVIADDVLVNKADENTTAVNVSSQMNKKSGRHENMDKLTRMVTRPSGLPLRDDDDDEEIVEGSADNSDLEATDDSNFNDDQEVKDSR